MAAEQSSKQRLALAICDFLSTSTTDGTLTAEDKDSIDVAINCIAESFKIDFADQASLQAATGKQSLFQIYSVYEKLKGANANNNAAAASSSSTSASASASASASSPSAPPASSDAATADASSSTKEPSEAEKKEAESLKSKGNAAMARKDYPSAIDFYTRALNLNPSNPVYLSNRAAAHSAAKDHHSAKFDAEAAVQIDPAYTKAWSRLGLARFALGDAKGAMEAYGKGIEHEGNGGSEAMKKGFETAKRRAEELDADSNQDNLSRSPPGMGGMGGGMPDLSSLAGMFGGGGGGGGGGMPDLSSIMNNPMFATMAQNMMSNPELINNLMSNPRLREMANSFSNGGGMPDLNALSSDPSIADMVRNMMGGGGGGANPNGPRR